MADGDIFQRAGGNIAVEGFNRAPELGSGLRCGQQSARYTEAWLATTTLGLKLCQQPLCARTPISMCRDRVGGWVGPKDRSLNGGQVQVNHLNLSPRWSE